MKDRRGVRIRSAAALIALAVVLAACQSGASGGGGATDADEASPGVSADTVTVGYLVPDVGTLSDRLGFRSIKVGDFATTSKGIQAVVDAVNTNGGVGGRKINAVIKPYDANVDTPEYAEAQCRGFTQDAQAFAVVIDGQFQNNARPCYRASRAIILDQTPVAHDQTEFQSFSPYLWAPSLPTFDTFVSTQLQLLQQANWFNGASGVEVVAPDTEVTRRVAQGVVLPELASLGITNTSEYYVDSSNAGTLGATTAAALTNARAKNIDHIFVIGGSRILAVMLSTQEAQDLQAVYSISSYDTPSFLVDNPQTIVAERRNGMAGLGFSAAIDMRLNSSDEVFPDPARPSEVLCKQIIDAAGATPPETARENYGVAMRFCDATLLLKAALDKAPKDNVTPNTFRDSVWSLGNTWTSALAYGSSWQKDQYAGATVSKGLVWDAACKLSDRVEPGCFRWGTGDLPLPPPTVATPAASTAPSVPASQPVATP